MDRLFLHIVLVSFLTQAVHGLLNCADVDSLGLTVNDTASVGDVIHDFGFDIQLGQGCDFFYVNGTQLLLNFPLRNPCVTNTIGCDFKCTGGFRPLIVGILKIDTGPPVFQRSSYYATVSELTPHGTVVFTFNASGAVDPDCDAKVAYQIEQNGGGNFVMGNTETGEVAINGLLFYEDSSNYTLTVRASNNGQFTTAFLYITVVDVDNKDPAFSQSNYNLNITEEVIQTILSLLHCYDQDTGINATILYSFKDMSLTSLYFDINPTTGQIQQTRPIDRETTASLELHVTCYQEDDHSKMTTSSVKITVLDINDNLPVFVTLDTNVTVTEHTSVFITTVKATDRDEGDNAVIRYNLVEGGDAFEIDSATGDIIVKSPELLDRDKTEMLNIQVRAEDVMGNFSQHNASVTVYLLDVNDNNPQFDLEQYIFRFNVTDMDAIIGTVVAHDDDVIDTPNSNVTYDVVDTWMIGADVTFPLTLDRYTGEISINAFVQTDIEYNMFIKACDNPVNQNDRRCAQCRVIAEYTANMTENVYFTQINMTINENLPIGTIIGQLPLSASSYDSFNISSEAFTIDSWSGMLVTAATLDREDQATFDFNIVFLSTTQRIVENISVTLIVLDVNDNAPAFSESEYYFSLPQHNDGRVVLGTLTANDNDSNENSKLLFRFHQNQLQEWFNLDHETGQLSLNPAWWQNNHRQPIYSLTVTVTDGGTPSLQDTALVHVLNMERVDNVSVMVYTEASADYINENVQQLQRDMADILGYDTITLDDVQEVTSDQKFIRTKFHLSASDVNGTYVPFEELQRMVVRRWYPLLALFQFIPIFVNQLSDGISASEIALIVMGGVILLGGIILVPVVCRQWNKHVREHQLYDHLRRPSTIYDSQELQLDFPEETLRSQFSSFRAPFRVKNEGSELGGSFGMAYVSPVFVDDDGNAPKTPTWSINEQPRIPLWSTSDSLKDVMASLEDLSDRLNAEDNISGVTELSRSRSLKSHKSRNSEASGAIDYEIVDWHAGATLTDEEFTSVFQLPTENTYVNVPKVYTKEKSYVNVHTEQVADSEIGEIVLKPNLPSTSIEESTAF